MKRNAIVRIVLFSLAIAVLLSILLTGLGIGMFMVDTDIDMGHFIQGGSSVDAAQVRDIEIEWASGKINIETADVDTISFQEEGKFSDDQQMVYSTDYKTLSICYSKPAIRIGFISTPSKDLTITVPENWQGGSIHIEAASADITLNNLSANSVELDSASGECVFTGCNLSELDVDTASGDITYNGIVKTLSCDAASADITAVLLQAPQSIDMDGASGSLDLTLPEDCGFTVELDSLSGNFRSDFTMSKNGDTYVCGNGACRIDVDSMSGDVIIRKAK